MTTVPDVKEKADAIDIPKEEPAKEEPEHKEEENSKHENQDNTELENLRKELEQTKEALAKAQKANRDTNHEEDKPSNDEVITKIFEDLY